MNTYKDEYEFIVDMMRSGLKYSDAVKEAGIASWKASRAFEHNGGKINSYSIGDIYIRDSGKLMDLRHRTEIRLRNDSSHGYLSFSLHGESRLVHRFIAEAMISNPENKSQVNHINGIKTDNSIANLEWCTPKENINHAFDTGLNHIRSKAGRSKLSEDEVIEIRLLLDTDMKQSHIAKKFNISPQTICDIKKGRIRNGRH